MSRPPPSWLTKKGLVFFCHPTWPPCHVAASQEYVPLCLVVLWWATHFLCWYTVGLLGLHIALQGRKRERRCTIQTRTEHRPRKPWMRSCNLWVVHVDYKPLPTARQREYTTFHCKQEKRLIGKYVADISARAYHTNKGKCGYSNINSYQKYLLP